MKKKHDVINVSGISQAVTGHPTTIREKQNDTYKALLDRCREVVMDEVRKYLESI